MFTQRLRVFSGNYVEKSPIDLSQGDKIIVPDSFLQNLRQCKDISFPIMVNLKPKDNLNCSHYCFVADFNAPEGIVYIPEWLITKLNLDKDGASVVKVSPMTTTEMSEKCPVARFLRLSTVPSTQYSTLNSLAENPITTITKHLNEYHSSVSIGDVIPIPVCGQIFTLKIDEVGSSLAYRNAPTVRLISNVFSVTLTQPKENKPKPAEILKKEFSVIESQDLDSESEEWEIISVGKIKNSELISSEAPFVVPVPGMEEKDDVAKEKENPLVWSCLNCKNSNSVDHKFCPRCGAPKPKIEKVPERLVFDEEKSVELLEIAEEINPGNFKQNETKKTGWILKNVSGMRLRLQANLIQIASIPQIKIVYDPNFLVDLKAGEQMFLMVDVTAPEYCATYHVKFKLVRSDYKSAICKTLDLSITVQSDHSQKYGKRRENTITEIMQMGFRDRDRVILALEKWEWDICKAVNWLATH